MTAADAFLDDLRDEVLTHPAIDHPLLDAFAQARVFRAGVRHFAALYTPHILKTRRYQAQALAVCEDEPLQGVLAEILTDEYGHGDPTRTHPAIYRRFLDALDVDHAGTTSPAHETYARTHFTLCAGDWRVAIGTAGLAMEWPIPPMYAALVPGLRAVGLDDDALELFLGHMEIDVEHGRMVRDALAPHLDDETTRVLVAEGVRRSMDARLAWHDALWRALERYTSPSATSTSSVA